MSIGVFTRCGLESVRLLAIGSMSEISLVRDRGGQFKVLKQLLPHFASDQEAQQSLKSEYDLLQLIDSPHVMRSHQLLSMLIDDDHQPRYALLLDWIEGVSLREVLRQARRDHQPLSRDEVHVLITGLTVGLKAMHTPSHSNSSAEFGTFPVVHNDLSPLNIMIDINGRAVIADLSSAHSLHPSHTSASYQGKRAYMSPERLQGEEGSLAGDAYALGCLWFELVTETSLSSTLREAAHLWAERGWPVSWVSAVIELTSKDPRERVARLTHLGALLADELNDERRAQAQHQLSARARRGAERTSSLPSHLNLKLKGSRHEL
jgi:serine/threonine protein kinase